MDMGVSMAAGMESVYGGFSIMHDSNGGTHYIHKARYGKKFLVFVYSIAVARLH